MSATSQEYLTIGEIAALLAIDVQTLRYYDSIGLLVPASRDTQSGYRLYRFDQIYRAVSIRYLRRLGYSIKQIRHYLDSRTLDNTLQQLTEQSQRLKQQWNELMGIDCAIQRKLAFIKQQLPLVDIGEVTVKTFGDRYYLDIGLEENLYGSDVFYFYPTLVFNRGKEKHFGAYLFAADRIQNTQILAGGQFLCAYHRGAYEAIHESVAHIREHAKERQLADWEVCFNILDQFVEWDTNKFITEIQIPILRSEAHKLVQ